MDKHLELNQNPLVNYFKKHPEEFTKADFIDYVRQHEVRLVNFMYPGEDGKLKTLNFVVNNLEYLETILSEGERVDGSSLFPSFVEAGNSDLYVVPRFRSAFLDPFAAEPTLCFLCSFYSKDGSPFDASPSETLVRAAASFREATGMEFEAMGELEYYVIAPEQPLFPTPDQRGYHESAPFAKFGAFRQECMKRIAQTGGLIKYGHSEVGNFSSQGRIFEQNEIEFLPCAVESAADQLLLAKWVIRNLAYEQGLDITFAPKIVVGEAGSGLHIHMRITKDGHSLMLDNDLKLSTVARRAIAGMMKLAPAITAFGNKNPTSYLRLVPHQEAPTNVCWGDSNRSALVRVPLGWTSRKDMCAEVNPQEKPEPKHTVDKQTFEMRSPDCSADIYQLMAGLCVAAREGLTMPEAEALQIAADKYVAINIHASENAQQLAALETLPTCCVESAQRLEADRAVFEAQGVFRPRMIDGIVNALRKYDDTQLHKQLEGHPDKVQQLVNEFFYCG